MRVLIWSFVPPSPDSAYWFWLKDGMEAVGHQVIAVDAFALTTVFGVRAMQEILLAYADAYQVQAAMVLPQNFVETWFLDALRQRGVALVSFRYDDGMMLAEGQPAAPVHHVERFGYLDAHCDLSVTICRQAVSAFAAQGQTAPVYLPLPYPWQCVPLVEKPLRPVIAFAGSPKFRADAPLSARVALLRGLAAAGLPVEAHHDGWAEVPGCAAFARPTPTLGDFHDVFRTATVNLSIASDWSSTCCRMIKQLNMEIAAAGGMQISSPSDELADFFVAGSEVELAETLGEFITKSRYYLAHPDEARRMGRASRHALERQGGWQGWWQRVASHLAAAGIPLDLAAAPIPAQQAANPTLCMAAAALAHAYEAFGDPVMARIYHQEVLAYRPDDYSALTGLARLAGSDADARPLWRQASQVIGRTLNASLDRRLGMPGVPPNGTSFKETAARQWLMLALAEGDYQEAMTALATVIPIDARLAPQISTHLMQGQQPAWAKRALDLHLSCWPDDVAALRQRVRVADLLGDQAQKQADFAAIQALTQGPG